MKCEHQIIGNARDPGLKNTIIVAKSGGHYDTIYEALSVATAGIFIWVAPGQYSEPPLTVPDGVTAEGMDKFNVVVIPIDPNSPLFTVGNISQVGNMFINGVTNSQAVYSPPGVTDSNIYDVIFDNCLDGIKLAGNNAYLVCERITSLSSITRAIYSVATGTIGALICNDLLTRGGTSTQSDSGVIQLNSFQGENGVNALYANGGEIIVNSASLYNITNGLRANNNGIIRGSGISVARPGTWDVLQEDSGSQILVSSAEFSSDRISAVNFTNVRIDFNDTKEDNEAYAIYKDIYNGTAELGRASAFGGGNTYTRGMLVFTETPGGTFADVSAAARSASASTFTYPGTAADNAIYVASSLLNGGDYLKHLGIWAKIQTAAVIGSGEIALEYWNGSSWVEFHHMSTEDTPDFYPHAEQIFERTGEEHVNFEPNIEAAWVQNDPISPPVGTNYFWTRHRIKTAITTAPIFEQFKLHPNSKITTVDGWDRYFGSARPIRTIPWDWNTFKTIPPNSTGDVNLFALNSPLGSMYDLAAGLQNNSFTTGVFKRVGKAIAAPGDIDTSAPLNLKMLFHSAGAGDAAFLINFGVTQDLDALVTTITSAPTSIRGEQHIWAVKTGVAADQQFSLDVDIDVSKVVARRLSGVSDAFWITIVREANAGSDTIAAAVNPLQLLPTYTAWSQGSHQ